jgi:uncharacterized GH25 family protein
MTHTMKTGIAAMALVAVTLGAAACGRSEQASQAPAVSEAPAAAPAGSGPVEITFKTDPDPAKTGDNVLEVMVMQDGKPVSDAAVSAEFYMPAMPAMKMAEMRSKTDLSSAGDGVYRGNGQVMMAGNWEVTVMAMRNGQELASKKLTVTAK